MCHKFDPEIRLLIEYYHHARVMEAKEYKKQQEELEKEKKKIGEVKNA